MKLFFGRAVVDVGTKDMFGSGLLSRAVGGGHEPVVKPLLDRNVDANFKDEMKTHQYRMQRKSELWQ